MIHDLIEKLVPDFHQKPPAERFAIEDALRHEEQDSFEQVKVRYYQLLNSGELDLNNLLKQYYLYVVFEKYNLIECMRAVNPGEKVNLARARELTMYPTFTDYYNRVLR